MMVKRKISWTTGFSAIALTVFLCGCSNSESANGPVTSNSAEASEPDLSAGKSVSVFVASDRHDNGKGNNLTASLQMVTSRMDAVTPQTVLLGGDYVGSGGGKDMQPQFSTKDIEDEVYRVLDRNKTDLLFTYGSHDRNSIEGYAPFFSGPKREQGFYIYGISYVQMSYKDDATTKAALERSKAYTDSIASLPDSLKNVPMPPPPDSIKFSKAAFLADDPGYNGIDIEDPFGMSATPAAKYFTTWVNSLSDNAPIIMMSHVPLHYNREDNFGAETWFKTIEVAAQKHDIIFFYAHNHTLEEKGDSAMTKIETDSHMMLPGDSITVQGDSLEGTPRHELNFIYANAGYLKLGWSSLVTFTDIDTDDNLDYVSIRRFNILGENDSYFGSTDKKNPLVFKLQKR